MALLLLNDFQFTIILLEFQNKVKGSHKEISFSLV
jgi:hypothetical protein